MANNRLFDKLDAWSICETLNKIEAYEYEGNQNESQYYDYYADLINEMSCIAADMWNDFDKLINDLEYKMPYKNVEFYAEDESRNGYTWFNTCVAMISDCDMIALLDNEGKYFDDEDKEKDKRRKAIERLTKTQIIYLYTKVFDFIKSFLELKAAFNQIVNTINELDYHHSFLHTKDGSNITPETAWVE